METYYVKTKCGNCGSHQSAEIPKGTTISAYLRSETCNHCGCASLHESDVPNFTEKKYIMKTPAKDSYWSKPTPDPISEFYKAHGRAPRGLELMAMD